MEWLIPASPEYAPYLIATQILCGIGAIVMFLYIRHKQETGQFKGIPSLPRAILFTLFVFGVITLWIIIWEGYIIRWIGWYP